MVVCSELARDTSIKLLELRLALLVEDDVRRVRLLPRHTDSKVLDGAHVPAGGPIEDVRREDPAAAERSLLLLVLERRAWRIRIARRRRLTVDERECSFVWLPTVVIVLSCYRVIGRSGGPCYRVTVLSADLRRWGCVTVLSVKPPEKNSPLAPKYS